MRLGTSLINKSLLVELCFGVGPSSNELNLDRTSLRSKRRNAKEVAGVSPTHSSPLRSKPFLSKGYTFLLPE